MLEIGKAAKKVLRGAIDVGLQKDFADAIIALDGIIGEWKEKKLDNREGYHALYSAITKHDKIIARRYDGLTGSRYLGLVCELYAKKSITDADLEGLDPEILNRIKQNSELW